MNENDDRPAQPPNGRPWSEFDPDAYFQDMEAGILRAFGDGWLSREECDSYLEDCQAHRKWCEHKFEAEATARRNAPIIAALAQEPISRIQAYARAAQKSNWRCWYCGAAVALHLEHQVPTSRGGRTTASNCVLACRTCNSQKGTRTVEEYRVYMMVAHGRPPEPFVGEPAPAHQRDWMIVCDTPLAYTPGERVSDRVATYLR